MCWREAFRCLPRSSWRFMSVDLKDAVVGCLRKRVLSVAKFGERARRKQDHHKDHRSSSYPPPARLAEGRINPASKIKPASTQTVSRGLIFVLPGFVMKFCRQRYNLSR